MKKFIALILALLLAQTAFASTPNFNDVGDDEIYRSGIEYLANLGVINGNPDGSYKPLNTVNRAELVKILVEAQGASSAASGCFPDLQAGAWYESYVCVAHDLGWVQGYQDGNFRPGQAVSFVEALKIVYKAYQLPYDDNANPWYRDLVNQASNSNYIPHTISAFDSGLQRNQMADLVARIEKDRAGELDQYLGDRADIVVTYDTITDGIDLTQLKKIILCAESC